MNYSRVIVVGAGMAGLVAAYQLKKKGFSPIVLEASARVGGRMVTRQTDGYIIDEGAQFLSSGYPLITDLIKEFNLGAEFVETSRLVGVVRNGSIKVFKYDKPFSLVTGGLLDMQDWLIFMFGSIKLSLKTRQLPLNNYAAWHKFDDQSSEDWSRQHFGHQVTDYIIEPLLEALYFQTLAETSRALPMIINAFGTRRAKTKTLTTGIGSLPERIAKELEVRLRTPVREIRFNGVKVLIKTDDKSYLADRVILATPAPISRQIYKTNNTLEKELLATQYSSTINITIALKAKLPPEIGLQDVYGVWIPKKDRKIIAAFTIESAKNTNRAATGELVHVMLSSEAGKLMISQKEDVILRKVLNELEQYLPTISKNVAFTKIFRWQYAEPKSPIGRCRNIKAYRDFNSNNNRVILAGDYMGMPFTEGAAETGRWAASKILGAKASE